MHLLRRVGKICRYNLRMAARYLFRMMRSGCETASSPTEPSVTPNNGRSTLKEGLDIISFRQCCARMMFAIFTDENDPFKRRPKYGQIESEKRRASSQTRRALGDAESIEREEGDG